MADLADKSPKKTLKDLKARLGELQGPEDNTVATKNFYKKHKTVSHPDPAGNGDDVFKATNVRTVNRSPDHGYNPGEDAAVYEGYDTESMPYFGSRSKLRDRIAAGKLGKSHAGPIRGGRTSEPHPNPPYDPNSKSKHVRDMYAAYMYNFKREKERSWRPSLDDERDAPALSIEEVKSMTSNERIAYHKTQAAINMGAARREKDPGKKKQLLTQAKRHLRLINQYERLQNSSYDPEGNRLDEIFGLSKKEKAKKTAEKIMNNPRSPWIKAQNAINAVNAVNAAIYYGTLKQSYCDPRIYDIFAHLSEENKELFLQVLGEEDGYERIAEAFGLTEEE